jgi:glutamate racemase
MSDRDLVDSMIEATQNFSNAIDNYINVHKLATERFASFAETNEKLYELSSKKMSVEQLRAHFDNITKYIRS